MAACGRIYTETASDAAWDRTRLAVARARGRKGGRLPALDARNKAAGLALLRDPAIPMHEAARRPGVPTAALYSHFLSGRAAALETAPTNP